MATYRRKSRKSRNSKRKMRKPQDHPRIELRVGTRVTRRQSTKSAIRKHCQGASKGMRIKALRELKLPVAGLLGT